MQLRNLASIALACLVLTQAPRPLRSEPETVESGLPVALAEAAKVLLTRAVQTRTGLRAGMTKEEVGRFAKGAAEIVGDHAIVLADTPYAPTKETVGLLRLWLDPEVEKVTELTITLLTGPYEVAAMRRHLLKVGKELGLVLTEDPDNDRTLFDEESETKGIDTWLAMGAGTLVVEVSVP